MRFTVGSTEAGATLQRLLRDRRGGSHASARALISGGAVSVNGRVVLRPAERLAEGDRVEVAPDPQRGYRVPRRAWRTRGFRIVYEDRDVVVVDKEAGVLAVKAPSSEAPSVQQLLEEHYRRRGFKQPRVYPAHRIDRFTSGLVVFARSPAARAALRRQFASREPERVYLAVAEGRVEPPEGRLADRLVEQPRSLKVHPTRRPSEGKEAISRYRVLERFETATFVEVTLETGRRNQIRVQFQSRGHPVVGDVAYGHRSPWIGRTALHAHRLGFEHPTRRARLAFVSDPPADFRELLHRLRRRSV